MAREAYCIWARVFIHGVIQKAMNGVPPCVLQVDLTGKRAEAARGTIIAAVLEGDSKSSTLVVTSYYDQKSFYMIPHNHNAHHHF